MVRAHANESQTQTSQCVRKCIRGVNRERPQMRATSELRAAAAPSQRFPNQLRRSGNSDSDALLDNHNFKRLTVPRLLFGV